MSRILKRPMFRKGGSTSKGIMTGLVDRKQYAKGIDKEELKSNQELFQSILEEATPRTRVPYGAFGLDIATGTPVLEAFKKRYGQFTTADDKREAAIKGGAAKLGIAKALEKGKIPTLKQVRNTSNQALFGIEPGKTGFASASQIMSAPGALTPIDKSQKISVSPTGEVTITEGGQGDTKAITTARELKTTTFQMNNAGQNLIKNLQGSKVGPVGSFITALDSTGAQLKQAADSFGFNTTGPNKTYDEQGDAVDNYIRAKFGSQIGDDATKFAKVKSVSINLAYLMARIDEPGGRFTDRDIALKMEELGIGADPERTINVLTNALQLRNQNSAFAYRELTGKPLDFSGIPIVGQPPKIGKVPESKGVKEKTEDNDPYKIR